MDTAQFVKFADTELIQAKDPEPYKGTHPSNYYFGRIRTEVPGPQAFFGHFGPRIVNRAHFHHIDQFQLFFGSPGSTYQRHAIDPLMLHYTDANTLYGPFASGDDTLSLFVLRARGSNYKGLMPENKDELAPRDRRRHHVATLGTWLSAPLPAQGTCTIEKLFAGENDAMAAFTVEAGAGTTIECPDSKGSGGQYCVVVKGSVSSSGERFPELTLGWIPSDSGQALLTADTEGARLLVLQFADAA